VGELCRRLTWMHRTWSGVLRVPAP
jgi:hypothetical protein